MNAEGPLLDTLVRRIVDTPREFMAEPAAGGESGVSVPAVVHDLLAMRGLEVARERLEAFAGRGSARDRNRLGLCLVACWLLADEALAITPASLDAALAFLQDDLAELARHCTPAGLLGNPDRREELARLALARLGLRPGGESAAVAADRLTSLSSVERARLLQASRKAEERARKIREALARKAAEESADKWSRD